MRKENEKNKVKKRKKKIEIKNFDDFVDVLRDFKRAGVYHMLALSGLHVAILIGMCYDKFKR